MGGALSPGRTRGKLDLTAEAQGAHVLVPRRSEPAERGQSPGDAHTRLPCATATSR